MGSMKLLLVAIIALYSPIGIASTEQCKEIRNQLLAIEAKIQSSNEKDCSDCKSHLELQNKYNALMGKLIIYEGLIGIGKSIEDDHKAITKLDRPQVVKATKLAKSFITNYTKAALLDHSIEAGFWKRPDGRIFDGKSDLQYQLFYKSQCERDDPKIKSYCQIMERVKKDEAVNYRDIFTTLASFSKAHGHSLSDRDKEHNFEKYRKSLELSIDGKKVAYNSPEGAQLVSKVNTLRLLLKDQRKDPTDENSEKILAIAKGLEPVEVNYGDRIEQTNPKFQDYFDSKFKKGIAGFNHATRAIFQKDTALENLDKLEEVLENRLKASKQAIAGQIKDKASCSGDSFEKLNACFKSKCSPGHSGKCRQTNKNKSFVSNLHTISDQLKALDEFTGLDKRIQKAKRCIKSTNDQIVASDCINSLKRDLSLVAKDEVEQLKRDLHLHEAKLENLNKVEPFKSLKLSKAMGLLAYRNKCLREDKSVDGFKSLCGIKDIDSFAQSAISLSKDTQDIIDYSQNPFLNKGLKMPGGEHGIRVSEFLDNCKSTPTNPLCKMYKNDEVLNGKLDEKLKRVGRTITANKTKNRKVAPRVKFKESEEDKLSSQFISGMASTLLNSGVPFYLQMENSKMNHEMQMSYYQNRLSFMKSQREYFEANPQVYYYNSYPQTNYGYSLYDFGDATSFGGSSTTAMFNDPSNFGQFSFSFDPMDPYGDSNFTSTPGSTPATNPPSTGFTFGN